MTTAQASRLTQTHRAQQLLLRRATVAQVSGLWPRLDWAQLDATFPAFAATVAGVVQTNRQTSAGLAAGYLRASRRAHNVAGRPTLVLPEPLVVDQFTTALRVTSVVAAKRAVSAGHDADKAMSSALTQTTGAMARLVLNAGRQTVVESTKADPAAHGWERVLGGRGCDFCRMLAGRGGVYDADTADFEAHDHCGCSAAPVYGD